MITLTKQTQSITTARGYVKPVCSCGWSGVDYPTRYAESYALARRDAADHGYSHAHGVGWFDYRAGWVAGPND